MEQINQLQEAWYQIDDDMRWWVALISDTGMRLAEAAGLKTENLKLIPGSYDVTVSSKNICHFKNGKTQYWIALEPESSYSA